MLLAISKSNIETISYIQWLFFEHKSIFVQFQHCMSNLNLIEHLLLP